MKARLPPHLSTPVLPLPHTPAPPPTLPSSTAGGPTITSLRSNRSQRGGRQSSGVLGKGNVGRE
ncbi:hypothetical protein Pmani_025420, partial [Petrolisthes manimaculis]